MWNIGGPHTEGYTNFLLVLILSPFAFFNSDLLLVSQLIGIAATILTALAIFKLVTNISESDGWPFAAALMYLLLPFTWANAFSGLETSLFVLLVTSSFYYATKKKWSSAFILISFTALARPEGALAGMILALSIYWEDKSLPRVCLSKSNANVLFLRDGIVCCVQTFLLLRSASELLLYQNRRWFSRDSEHKRVYSQECYTGRAFLSLHAGDEIGMEWNELPCCVLWPCALVLFYLWPEQLQGFYERFDWAAVPALAIFASLALLRGKRNWKSCVMLALVINSDKRDHVSEVSSESHDTLTASDEAERFTASLEVRYARFPITNE